MTTSRDCSLSQPDQAQIRTTLAGVGRTVLQYAGVWGWVCLIAASTLFGQATDSSDTEARRAEATNDPPAKQSLDRLLGPQAITLDTPLLGGGARALDVGSVVTVRALAKLESSRQGQLQVSAVIQPGYHIYSLTQSTGPAGGPRPTTIQLQPAPGVQLAGPFAAQTEPHRYVDRKAWPGLAIEEHRGGVVWQAPSRWHLEWT